MSGPTEKSPPLGFARFRRRAAVLAEDRSRLKELSERALVRLERRSGAIASVVDDLRTMVRLINAWARAEYREIPKTTLVLVVAAVLYFVVPTDMIPDFIVGLGYLDDVAVIGWVARELRRELQAFRVWESGQDGMETFIGRSPLRDD